MYGMSGMDFGSPDETLVLNLNHPLIRYMQNHLEDDGIDTLVSYLYDTAKIAHGDLDSARLAQFLESTNGLVAQLYKG